MQITDIDQFKNGWIVGAFEPSLFKSPIEIGVHSYKKGQKTQLHYHEKCNEYNLILSGTLIVNGKNLDEGHIFQIFPYQLAEIDFLTDCRLLIIKDQSGIYDKVLVEAEKI